MKTIFLVITILPWIEYVLGGINFGFKTESQMCYVAATTLVAQPLILTLFYVFNLINQEK